MHFAHLANTLQEVGCVCVCVCVCSRPIVNYREFRRRVLTADYSGGTCVPDFPGGGVVQLTEHAPRGCRRRRGRRDVRRRRHRRRNVESVVVLCRRRPRARRNQRRRAVGELDGDGVDGAGRDRAVEVLDRLLGFHSRVVADEPDAFRQPYTMPNPSRLNKLGPGFQNFLRFS